MSDGMSYLTGPEIERLVREGKITIDPFVPEHVGPNSVDLRLHPELTVYAVPTLSMRGGNLTKTVKIPKEGLRLEPSELYLARTVERTRTPEHVPQVIGRSSVGRLGVSVHVTAGFGDVGFDGTWTLEISVIKPVWVFSGVRICQLSLSTIEGEVRPYEGRYQGQVKATASRFHE